MSVWNVAIFVYINSSTLFVLFNVCLFPVTEWIAFTGLTRFHPLPPSVFCRSSYLVGGDVTGLRVWRCVLWFYHFWLEVDLENSVPLTIKQENWITQFWYSYSNPCFGYWNRKAVPQNEESCGSGQKLMISKEVLPAKRWMLSTKFSPLTN